MPKAGWLFVFLALVSPFSASAQDETITKIEVRTAPPDETNRRLRDVVWQVFEVEDYRREGTPERPLSEIWLTTSPHATDIIGLCRYDDLQVDFRSVDPDVSGPLAQVVPIAVNSTSYWSFVTPPEFDQDNYSEERQDDAICPASDDNARYFRATDEIEATEGYLAWVGLRRDLTEGRSIELDCNLFRSDTAGCAEVITSFPISALRSTERCIAGSYQGGCYVLYVDNRRIIVEFDSSLGGTDPRTMQARLDSLIILTHEAVD